MSTEMLNVWLETSMEPIGDLGAKVGVTTVALIAEGTIGGGNVRSAQRIHGGIAAIISTHGLIKVTVAISIPGMAADIKGTAIHGFTTGIADIFTQNIRIDIGTLRITGITMGITGT